MHTKNTGKIWSHICIGFNITVRHNSTPDLTEHKRKINEGQWLFPKKSVTSPVGSSCLNLCMFQSLQWSIHYGSVTTFESPPCAVTLKWWRSLSSSRNLSQWKLLLFQKQIQLHQGNTRKADKQKQATALE